MSIHIWQNLINLLLLFCATAIQFQRQKIKKKKDISLWVNTLYPEPIPHLHLYHDIHQVGEVKSSKHFWRTKRNNTTNIRFCHILECTSSSLILPFCKSNLQFPIRLGHAFCSIDMYEMYFVIASRAKEDKIELPRNPIGKKLMRQLHKLHQSHIFSKKFPLTHCFP